MGREPDFVSVDWAARKLRLSRKTLWRRFRRGMIAGLRLGRLVRIEWPLRHPDSVPPSAPQCPAGTRPPSKRRR